MVLLKSNKFLCHLLVYRTGNKETETGSFPVLMASPHVEDVFKEHRKLFLRPDQTVEMNLPGLINGASDFEDLEYHFPRPGWPSTMFSFLLSRQSRHPNDPNDPNDVK